HHDDHRSWQLAVLDRVPDDWIYTRQPACVEPDLCGRHFGEPRRGLCQSKRWHEQRDKNGDDRHCVSHMNDAADGYLHNLGDWVPADATVVNFTLLEQAAQSFATTT